MIPGDLHRRFLNPEEGTREEEAAFQEEIRDVEANILTLILLAALTASVLVWPTDWWLYEGDELRAFLTWRVLMLVLWGLVLTAFYTSDRVKQYAGSIAVTVMSISGFSICYLFGTVFESGFASPYFYWTYILPFLSCFVLSCSFFQRILANFVLVIPAFIGFILADPSHLDYQHAASPFLLQAGIIPVAVISGHLVHNLYRRYFFLNQELEESIRQKDFLFQEVNHRVKNNMQVIMSLLKLQSNRVDDQEISNRFLSIRQRIRTMALVHEKLYRTDEISSINLSTYLDELVSEVVKIHTQPDSSPEVVREFADEVQVDLQQAISVGLIVNELVSNALKHGLSDHSDPKLRVGINLFENRCQVTVSDNGGKLVEPVDTENSETFGLKIVELLAEQQLEGNLEIKTGEWSEFYCTFPLKSKTKSR